VPGPESANVFPASGPLVAVRGQNQFENPKSVRVSRFAVGFYRRPKSVRSLSARPHYRLAKAALSVSTAFRILWRKPLVMVIMAADDYICTRVIKSLPNGASS
jgi:hypothetical protein